MRAVLATAVASLAIATPAGAVSIPENTAFSLSTAQAKASRDKNQTCQSGSKKKVIFKSGRPPVVACEQPPRSNLLTPDQIATATAAALAAIG
jgi:hypothetical protein